MSRLNTLAELPENMLYLDLYPDKRLCMYSPTSYIYIICILLHKVWGTHDKMKPADANIP